MAYVKKTGKIYTDKHGTVHGDTSNVYAVVYPNVSDSRGSRKDRNPSIEIYASEAVAKDGGLPFESHVIRIKGDYYDDHYGNFLITGSHVGMTLKSLDKARLYAAIDEIMQDEITDFIGGNESSKNGVRGGWVWSDWKADE